MEKRRLELDGPGYSYPRSDEERVHDQRQGELLLAALRRAAARSAVLVVHEPAPELAHENLASVLESGDVLGTPFALARDLRDAPTVAELIVERGPAHWQEAVVLGRGL